MPKVAPHITNFTAGEWSPRLKGRVDLAKYYNACEYLQGMIVFPHGGATRSPGTYFVSEVKTSSKKTRTISFQFSTEQAYILELGDQYMRVYMDKGQVQDGGSPYELATPYLEAEIFQLQFAQSADEMYIVHENHPPKKLTRTSHISWTLTTVDFIDGPYRAQNKTATTVAPSAMTGNITLTASTPIFNADHVGALWRINEGTEEAPQWGYCVITEFTDTTHVNATVKKDFAGTAAKTMWREGAWSDYRGYPACVSFYERRLGFGFNEDQPDTFWLSAPFEYETMWPDSDKADGAVSDDSAITYSLGADEVNAIRWMKAGKFLGIGTTGGEFPARATSQDEPITPTNIQAKREDTKGGAFIMPVRIGGETMFVQKAGRKLLSFRWSWENDQHTCVDMTLLAEHITKANDPDDASGIVDLAYQQEPYSTLWAVRADGVLLGMTYLREHEVIAWHRRPTDGEVESVACIPAPSGSGYDEVWFVVKRIINGVTKRYIEYFNYLDYEVDQRDCFFVDCGLTYYDPKTITGATKTDPVVVTVVGHGYSNGDYVRIDKVKGMTELNGKSYEVANKTADTFQLKDVDGTGYTAYESGGLSQEMVDSLTGLNHLEGKSVQILTDGAVHPNKTVSGGGITLNYKSAKTHVGLGSLAILQPMELETPSALGTSQGEVKRIHKIQIKLYKSLGFKVGPDEDHLDIIPFRTSDDPMGEPPALFTGNIMVEFEGDHTKEATIRIVQDQPLPLTVLSIAPKLSVSMEG